MTVYLVISRTPQEDKTYYSKMIYVMQAPTQDAVEEVFTKDKWMVCGVALATVEQARSDAKMRNLL